MSNTSLPNPSTPLAYFEPDAAYQTSVALYVVVGSVSIMSWDILDNLSDDYKLLSKNKISIATITYFMSRIGALGYPLSAAIFDTAPTGHCAHFETVTDAFYPVALSFTGLLFFFRLRAIYNNNPFVIGFFFFLWLGLLGCTLLLPIQVLGGNIGNTPYCIDAAVPNSVFASILAPLVHDTLVFAAISYRLAQGVYVNMSLRDGFKVALFGKYLPTFTRSLLLDGQRYYLISLVSNLVAAVLVFNTQVPIPLRSIGAASNIVITNIMACRVYRKTRFGQYRESEISTTKMQETKGHLPNSFLVFAHTTAGHNDIPLSFSSSVDPGPLHTDNGTRTVADITYSTSKPKSNPSDTIMIERLDVES